MRVQRPWADILHSGAIGIQSNININNTRHSSGACEALFWVINVLTPCPFVYSRRGIIIGRNCAHERVCVRGARVGARPTNGSTLRRKSWPLHVAWKWGNSPFVLFWTKMELGMTERSNCYSFMSLICNHTQLGSSPPHTQTDTHKNTRTHTLSHTQTNNQRHTHSHAHARAHIMHYMHYAGGAFKEI